MASSVIHRCQHCGYETEISSSLSVFAEDPHCRQCGLSASESDIKMQDDLSALMSQHLRLENVPQQTSPFPSSHPAPITYITQHYHHSSHLASSTAASPKDTLSKEAEETLAQHGIDTSFLFPSQLNLFKNADLAQRDRLIQLWRVVPPRYGPHENAPGVYSWPAITMQDEEEAARQRYLGREQYSIDHTDGTVDEKEKQGQQQDNSQDSRPLTQESRNNAEPYVLSGYEALAQREYDLTAQQQQAEEQAKGNTFSHFGSAVTFPRKTEYNRAHDPIYESREWWKHDSDTQPMEHQYGAFEMMNAFRASAEVYAQTNAEDVDMN